MMRKPRPREIWLVRFPFSDLTSSKVRPSLVIAVHGQDVIVAGIFSRRIAVLRKTWVRIPDTHRRFVDTGLKRTSTLKAEKIAVVHESVLVRRLGQLPMSLWLESQQALKLALRLP